MIDQAQTSFTASHPRQQVVRCRGLRVSHQMHKSRKPDRLLHILAAERSNDLLRKTHQRLANELRFHDCVLGCAYE
jgi:hypothetical protein